MPDDSRDNASPARCRENVSLSWCNEGRSSEFSHRHLDTKVLSSDEYALFIKFNLSVNRCQFRLKSFHEYSESSVVRLPVHSSMIPIVQTSHASMLTLGMASLNDLDLISSGEIAALPPTKKLRV